jgi:hypothetical protein
MNKLKLLKKLLRSPENIRFGDFVTLVESYGFELKRTSGSHHIFKHPEKPELLNLQNYKGKAKPYQIRQFLDLIGESI